MNTDTQTWYIVKQSNGQCEVCSRESLEQDDSKTSLERWGPFNSQSDAIARRVGLIRAGKCQPA